MSPPTTVADFVGLTSAARKRIASRRRMLLAGLRFMEGGQFRLTPLQIASKAQMHMRSFHVIFGDMPSYYLQLIDEHGPLIRAAINRAVKEDGKDLVQLMLLGE
ncbi:MAG: hypothetical protein WC829_14315 [Hyphomicrobium sp.]|jgi:hypothetical protein